MTPAPSPGAKPAPTLDFRKSLLETFVLNVKANRRLLSHIPDTTWQVPPPYGEGHSIADGHLVTRVRLRQIR